jgi:hypothetical protein
VKPGFGITEYGMNPRYMMAWPLDAKAIKINELAASRIYVALNRNEEEALQDNQKMVLTAGQNFGKSRGNLYCRFFLDTSIIQYF